VLFHIQLEYKQREYMNNERATLISGKEIMFKKEIIHNGYYLLPVEIQLSTQIEITAEIQRGTRTFI
jgi:hypothetical protein